MGKSDSRPGAGSDKYQDGREPLRLRDREPLRPAAARGVTADERPWWVAVVDPPGGPARAFASWQAADARCAAEYCRALLATRPDLPAEFVFVNGVRLSLYPGPVRPGGWQSRGALAKRAAARAALLATWRPIWAAKLGAGKRPPTADKSAHGGAPKRQQPPAAGSGG